MSLKTDYKDDAYEGRRKYQLIHNSDGTISLEDVTDYKVQGDYFNGYDANTTNEAVNKNTQDLNEERNIREASISDLDKALTKVYTVTFPVGGWSASAPYTQQISVQGMKDTDNPIPGLVYPSNMTEAQKENIDKSSDMITEIETLNGYLKATCKFKKPITDITIGLKGR